MYFIYYGRFFKNLLTNDSNYIRLTPPRFDVLLKNKLQKGSIYDKYNKIKFNYYIETFYDSITVDQVFSRDEYSLRKNNFHDLIDSKYRKILESEIKPLVIDCGANIGLSTKYFSLKYPDAVIVGVEPDDNNIKLAKLNTSLDNNENINLIEGAVLSKSGYCKFVNGAGTPNNQYQVSYTDDETDIRSYSISEIVDMMEDKYGKCSLLIVKIDIEGSESDLFSDNTGWINKTDLIYIELHDWMLPGALTSRSFLSSISQEDRNFILSGENVISVKNY